MRCTQAALPIAARITAKYLVAADAQGLGTHGVARVPTYCDHLEVGPRARRCGAAHRE